MSNSKIVIVDYQAGNLRSVQKAIERFDVTPSISSNPDTIREADALVFPGQGACDSAMRHIRSRGLEESIKQFIRSDKPFLGVCLGLQLLLEGSEEGDEPGLGALAGWVRRLPEGQKIPHIGWNQVRLNIRHPVVENIPDNSDFYFVHSYYADPADRSVVTATTEYGVRFCSIATRGNLIAVQFHPEKSGDLGLKIYENFIRLVTSVVK